MTRFADLRHERKIQHCRHCKGKRVFFWFVAAAEQQRTHPLAPLAEEDKQHNTRDLDHSQDTCTCSAGKVGE